MRSPFSDKHISERSEKKGVNMEKQIYSNEEEVILSKVEINKCTCVTVSAVPILFPVRVNSEPVWTCNVKENALALSRLIAADMRGMTAPAE